MERSAKSGCLCFGEQTDGGLHGIWNTGRFAYADREDALQKIFEADMHAVDLDCLYRIFTLFILGARGGVKKAIYMDKWWMCNFRMTEEWNMCNAMEKIDLSFCLQIEWSSEEIKIVQEQ